MNIPKIDHTTTSVGSTRIEDHPTVRRYLADKPPRKKQTIDSDWLRKICAELGADDAGFVAVSSPALGDEREKALEVFPKTKSLVSIVCRMNRNNVRNPARSLSNAEFHSAGEEVDHIARKLVTVLESKGVNAVNVTMGFPKRRRPQISTRDPSWR